jgi:iron transport multicopper oxidase
VTGALALVFAGGPHSLTGSVAVADPGTISNSADELRSGWYPDEPGLSPARVRSGDVTERFSTEIDGQVYAQPLVANGTLFVATESNWIYGIDPLTGATRWSRNVGQAFDPTLPPAICEDLVPTVGITSTPAIDPATNTAYFTSKVQADVSPPGKSLGTYFMHAVDIRTGEERPSFPVQIRGAADDDPNGNDKFKPSAQLQRPGLLLMNGVVYAAFGTMCDRTSSKGWVFGISATSGEISTIWRSTVAGDPGGGIWQGGTGLISDRSGSLIVATGNGEPGNTGYPGGPTPGSQADTFDAHSDSIVRLDVQPDGTLRPSDFFMMHDNLWADDNNNDFISVVALPDAFGRGTVPHLVLAGAKNGVFYLLDRDALGGYRMGAGGGDATVQKLSPFASVFGRPAAWPGDGGYAYMAAVPGEHGDPPPPGQVLAFRSGQDGAGNPRISSAGASTEELGYGSGSPIVTSEGTASGSAVVWVVQSPGWGGVGGNLRAYDSVPRNGTLELLGSWPLGTVSKFSMPGVGSDPDWLYVGTRDGHVRAFGAGPSASVAPPPGSGGASPGPGPGSATGVLTTRISGLRLQPRRFRVSPLRGATTGAKVTLTASARVSLRITISKIVVGRRSGTRCVVGGPAIGKAGRCTLTLGLRGHLTRTANTGTNVFRFRSRFGRALEPGAYVLKVTPKAAAGQLVGRALSVPFRVIS